MSTKDLLKTWGYTQTESEKMEKDIPCKWRPKESWYSCTYIG